LPQETLDLAHAGYILAAIHGPLPLTSPDVHDSQLGMTDLKWLTQKNNWWNKFEIQ
jgi:hypothetical protein